MTGATDGMGNTTRFVRDGNQRITEVLYPDGSQRTISYDCCAPISSTNEVGQVTSVSRDDMLMPTMETAPPGETLSYDYDGLGRLYGLTLPDGGKTYAFYGGDNLINGIQDAAGNSLSIQRDDAGRIDVLTDQIGVNTQYGYDMAGRVVQVTDALSKTRVFTRDVMGRVTQIQTARGGTLGFVYDKDGRGVSEHLDGQKVVEFTYAADGTLISMVDAWGTTSYAYDKNGQVKSINYPNGNTLAYTYNSNGMPVTVTYPGGLTVTYQYNTRNRLIGAAWGANHISFNHDAAGNLLAETRSNNTSTAYLNDAMGRVMGITHKRGSATLASLSFTRDSAGRIIKQNIVLPNQAALPTQGAQVTYNTAGQLAAFANATWSYDADGNAKTVVGGVSGSFTHDSFNRLTAMTWGGVNASFLFDGKGNRVRIERGGNTRYLHYNQIGKLMFETDGSNNLLSCYVYTDRRLSALYRPGEGSYFYHFDQNGSTLAITDTVGVTQKTYAYLPFGAVAGGSGILENRFTYVGAWGVNDDGEGLFFMRNRMYDAGTRRFLERDPIGWNGGENLYAYCANNPVEFIDPFGLDYGTPMAGGTTPLLTNPNDSTFGMSDVQEDLPFELQIYRELLFNVKKYTDKMNRRMKKRSAENNNYSSKDLAEELESLTKVYSILSNTMVSPVKMQKCAIRNIR